MRLFNHKFGLGYDRPILRQPADFLRADNDASGPVAKQRGFQHFGYVQRTGSSRRRYVAIRDLKRAAGSQNGIRFLALHAVVGLNNEHQRIRAFEERNNSFAVSRDAEPPYAAALIFQPPQPLVGVEQVQIGFVQHVQVNAIAAQPPKACRKHLLRPCYAPIDCGSRECGKQLAGYLTKINQRGWLTFAARRIKSNFCGNGYIRSRGE